MIVIKRIYDPPAGTDGTRVLVDRLWPRGVSREAARLDHWAKAIAPSTELRIWYDHVPARWAEFQLRYRLELSIPEAAAELARLRDIAAKGALSLLTATRNESENHAVVLRDLLGGQDIPASATAYASKSG